MRDDRKTKKQLTEELAESRRRLAELEEQLQENRERKTAEAELQKSQSMLDHAQEIARLGYWEFDLNRGTVWASSGARRIYGLEEQEWTIKQVQQIPLPEYRQALDDEMRGLVNQEKGYDIEFKIRRTTDGRIIDIHSMAEYNAH